MSDDHIKSEITLFLTGGLTESRNRQIEAHAAACEKCRSALTKAKAKQARIKREALKKASSDPLPNLFLARQGKETGIDRPPSNVPWVMIGILIVGGAGYWSYRHKSLFSRAVATATEASPVLQSTGTAVVPQPSTTTLAAPEAAPVTTPVSPTPTPVPPKPHPLIPVLQEWRGADSGIKEPRLVVIRNKEAWEKLWAEMQQNQSLPEINFDSQIILGVFKGPELAGNTLAFGNIREMDNEVYAPYRMSVTGVPVPVSTITAATPSHPYLLALISRTDKKIRLTQREAIP